VDAEAAVEDAAALRAARAASTAARRVTVPRTARLRRRAAAAAAVEDAAELAADAADTPSKHRCRFGGHTSDAGSENRAGCLTAQAGMDGWRLLARIARGESSSHEEE
jgi:hypothetical protein